MAAAALFVAGFAIALVAEAPVPADNAEAAGAVQTPANPFLARRDELQQAAAQRRGEWDGVYRHGNGTSWRHLVYVEGQGYADQSGGCVSGAQSFGDVEREPGRLLLRSRYAPRPLLAEDLSTTPLLPVRWGERHYLIAENEIGRFVLTLHDYRSGRCLSLAELREAPFLLREDDRDKPLAGLPQLPAAWQRQLRREALHLRVTALRMDSAYFESSGSRRLRYELTLDRGSADDLIPGVQLLPLNWRLPSHEPATITAVREHESVASLEQWVSAYDYAGAPGQPAVSSGNHPVDAEVLGPVIGIEYTTGALPSREPAVGCADD